MNWRCELIPGTKQTIVISLRRFFHEHNSLINVFNTAIDGMPTDEYKIVIHTDKLPYDDYNRRYNLPTVNEVEIAGYEFDSRDIQKRTQEHTNVSETYTMHYNIHWFLSKAKWLISSQQYETCNDYKYEYI